MGTAGSSETLTIYPTTRVVFLLTVIFTHITSCSPNTGFLCWWQWTFGLRNNREVFGQSSVGRLLNTRWQGLHNQRARRIHVRTYHCVICTHVSTERKETFSLICVLRTTEGRQDIGTNVTLGSPHLDHFQSAGTEASWHASQTPSNCY
jgi:hypothetical protein